MIRAKTKENKNMEKIITDEIVKDAKDFLNELNTSLDCIELSKSQDIKFNSSEFRSSDKLNNNISKITESDYPIIYTIRIVQEDLLSKLLASFEKFQTLNQQKDKESKLNISQYNSTDSSCLYVGSSTTKFCERIKDHLGVRRNPPYSMNLSKWDEDMDYDIIISTYEIKSDNNEKISNFLVELIKQMMWDKLTPVFGKRSGR